MRHILLIDPLTKLVIKKDSSLLMALTFKSEGHQTYLLFEEDFYFNNKERPIFKVYDFDGKLKKNSFYIEDFSLKDAQEIELSSDDIIHMRIDPPFDVRYMRYLWILKSLKPKVKAIVNSPEGILINNEKIRAYEHKNAMPSFIGSGYNEFSKFANSMKDMGFDSIILKPLDLYQGIGVEKVTLDFPSLKNIFLKKVEEFKGAIIAQPFIEKIEQGEIRSIYYRGEEIGNIIKIPPEGEFLANIARGAKFEACFLSSDQKNICDEISQDLLKDGVDLIAFDILDNYISEVNVTCPGLLVEVSEANQNNLASQILKLINF